MRCKRDYKDEPKGYVMFLTFLLSRLARKPHFLWSPALDLDDHVIYSTLIPGTQY
jgi:hypothetical protein